MQDAEGGRGATPVDRAVDRAVFWIERALALAFIAAVCIGFANVIGRYVLGHSILSAHEIQIYIMIFMTFLGAAVVTWRRQHLRMDVLIAICPEWLRRAARVLEFVFFTALAGSMLVLSTHYAFQMFKLGRVSDMAQIPMWLPHGAVAAGFGLMALMLLWRGAVVLASRTRARSGARSD